MPIFFLIFFGNEYRLNTGALCLHIGIAWYSLHNGTDALQQTVVWVYLAQHGDN